MDDTSLTMWLRLREQADWSARSVELTRPLTASLPLDQPVSVLDLGTGAGSNVRYLAPRLPPRQRWLAVDRSEALLSELVTRTSAWSLGRKNVDCEIDTRAQDLSVLDAGLFEGRQLVTASALLDLVSATWLRTLAAECRRAGASALFTITYDGRSSCRPEEPEDDLVRTLMNRHQARDKGLGGPAEGPRAAASAERAFAEQGYRVASASSDWALGPQDAAMQRMLIDGWAEAAAEMAPHLQETIAAWHARRIAHVEAGRSHIVVGHRDVAAWIETRGQG